MSSFRFSGGLLLCVSLGIVGCEESDAPAGGSANDAGGTLDGATSDAGSSHADTAHDTASDVGADTAPDDGGGRDGATGDAPRDTLVDAKAPDVSVDGGAPDGTVTADVSLDGAGQPDTSRDDSGLDVTSPEAASDSTDEGDALPPDPCGDGSAFAQLTTPSDQLACTSTMPCPEGMACVGATGWTCEGNWICVLHDEHPCPPDIVPFCGCDGVTFMSQATCADRPYVRIGACDDGFSCDPTDLLCPDEKEPTCPAGQMPTIVKGHYTTTCVPVSSCRCEFAYECPHREKYQCNFTTNRCEPLPLDAGGD